jgi:RimJ/RimL family protein N-acetyltransferase
VHVAGGGQERGPALTTERLRLRRWRASDREPFARLNADPEVMRYFLRPLTREESDALVDRIEARFDERGYGLWAAERRSDGLFVGFVGLAYDEIVSLTAVIHERSRRVMERLGMHRDPADDFDYPAIPEGNPLRRHVLYRLRREEFRP